MHSDGGVSTYGVHFELPVSSSYGVHFRHPNVGISPYGVHFALSNGSNLYFESGPSHHTPYIYYATVKIEFDFS